MQIYYKKSAVRLFSEEYHVRKNRINSEGFAGSRFIKLNLRFKFE